MTADTLHNEVDIPVRAAHLAAHLDVKAGSYRALRYAGYLMMIVAYAFIFGLAVLTLGLIEIRQTNLAGFNSLIAKLDEKDLYKDKYFKNMELQIDAALAAYQGWKSSLNCSDQVHATAVQDENNPSTVARLRPPGIDANGKDVPPTPCTIAEDHLNSLSLLKEDLLFRRANLPQWYDKYRDGIRSQTPQLIPILGLVDSSSRMVTTWARMPFELLEMLLLVCMGALGGVIGVTRVLVDTSTPNPSARDLCYRPVAGAVIALGIYILFRAAQLFFGGGSQDASMASTSVFVLAALGLASGFSAREAIAQIELATTRILRRAESGRDDDQSRTAKRGDPQEPAGAPSASPIGTPTPA